MSENSNKDLYIENLKNQIWATRISRVNSEKRLKSKESFIEAMNIYYSCFTVLISVGLLIWPSFGFSLLATAMTIILMISILYFKSLHYIDLAVAYRKDYTELQKLEFQLSHKDLDLDNVKQIESYYCDLLASGENHITFDYLKTLANSKKDYKKSRWNTGLKIQYYWGMFWRMALKLFCINLPIILSFCVFWGNVHGWYGSL